MDHGSPDAPLSGNTSLLSNTITPKWGQEHHHRDGRCQAGPGRRRSYLGGFGTSGQRCTAASRVVVHQKVYPEFVESSRAGRKAFAWGTASMARPKWGRSSAKIDSGRSKNTSGSARMKAPDSCAGATGSPTASMPKVSSMSRPFSPMSIPGCALPGRNLWSGRLGYSLHPRKCDRDRKRRDLRSVFPPSTPRTSMPRSRPCGI